MGGFRAKDADRDRYVDIIEAAYVDGQLGEQDRELRVSRALTAETLDELDSLTRDLQRPPGAPAPSPRPPATAPASRRRLAGTVAGLGAVVAVLGAGVLGLVVFSASDESRSGTSSTSVVSGEAVPVPAESEGRADRSFTMTPAGVRQFLRAYEAEFGTREAFEAGFYPDRVGAQVPVRGSRPRMERWSWDGTWRQDTEASAVRGRGGGTVDLGAIDVRRLFANIATARTTLRVDDGDVSHVLVHRWFGDGPSVDIHVANDYGESGYLKTTPAGDVVRSHPYEP